jgi:hypothetical protein
MRFPHDFFRKLFSRQSKQCSYRSAEALRRPKPKATSSFSAACSVVPIKPEPKIGFSRCGPRGQFEGKS